MPRYGALPKEPPPLIPLAAQPDDVPWPTEQWPEGDLDPRADKKRVDEEFEAAFGSPQPGKLGRTHGLLVVHRGRIVAEGYGSHTGPQGAHASWSVAKSFTQALVGVHVREGNLDLSAPMPVAEWPEGDPRRAITIDQMLRMTDGLRFREAEHLGQGRVRYYPDEESDVIPMLFGEGKPDHAAWAATLPRVHAPDEVWNYNTGGSYLLARLVGQTAGDSKQATQDFMQRELFEPLGMKSPIPKFDEAGTFRGGSEIYCSARDYARFGYLYLRDGVWDGRRILPEGWVDYTRTTTPQSDGQYGAHFWTIPGSLGMFHASGAFGQRIIIVPKLDLLVVRFGETPAEQMDRIEYHLKALVDAFRPTAD